LFDAKYFRSQLATHIEAAGPKPTVEVHLVSGQGHRARSVIEAGDGYVVLEVYQRRTEMTRSTTAWKAEATEGDTHRAVVSYESIAQVVITPSEAVETSRIGFGAHATPAR